MHRVRAGRHSDDAGVEVQGGGQGITADGSRYGVKHAGDRGCSRRDMHPKGELQRQSGGMHRRAGGGSRDLVTTSGTRSRDDQEETSWIR